MKTRNFLIIKIFLFSGLSTLGQNLDLKYSFLIPSNPHSQINHIIDKPFEEGVDPFPNFGDAPNGVWVRIRLTDFLYPDKSYSFVTRGVDTLKFYLVNAKFEIIQSLNTGGHFNPYDYERSSPYSKLDFQTTQEAVWLYIFAKNVNYKLSLFPFFIESKPKAERYIDTQKRIQNVYIGSMSLLILFGITLLVLFKNKLYLFYTICVFLSLSMMIVNYEYPYIFYDRLPEVILNKNIYGYLTTLLPLNYFLFAKNFLIYPEKVRAFIDKAQPYIIAITFVLLVFFAITDLSFFKYRNVIEPVIFILIAGPVFLMIKSLQMGYKPAWLFFLATMPVLFMGILESLSDIHNFPVQRMHTYYYVATFFELFLLTIGLSIKFKNYQEERNLIYEKMLSRELEARDEERNRIANDIHDRLGSLLAVVMLQLNVFRDKIAGTSDTRSLDSSIRILDESTKTARSISHSYTSSSFLKLGLIEGLKEMYNYSENPHIYVNATNFSKRLISTKENALFDIIQEIVANAIRHAEATEILINFSEKDDGRVEVDIYDDGIGFNPKSFEQGLGIKNIKFRVKEHLKGTVLFRSEPGAGTTIKVFFERD